MSILKNKTQDVLCLSLVNELDVHFQPMSDSLNALDKKTSSIPTRKDAKKDVKSLVPDTTMDETMEKIFQISGALFAMSSKYVIVTSLLRHPNQFAGIIDGKRPSAAAFKQSPCASAMKESQKRLTILPHLKKIRQQHILPNVIARENKQIPKKLQHNRHKGVRKAHQKRKPLKSQRKAKSNSKMYICK